jgi:hypothetical protein
MSVAQLRTHGLAQALSTAKGITLAVANVQRTLSAAVAAFAASYATMAMHTPGSRAAVFTGPMLLVEDARKSAR